MIMAVAGRRVDAANSEFSRFPLRNVGLVRRRLRALFESNGAEVVVSSAACGADLIALSEARALGLRRRIVLPFSRSKFRDTSVTDRPGTWGPIYDEIVNEAEAADDLVVLDEAANDRAYRIVNRVILDTAIALMDDLHQPGTAVLIWRGQSRGDDDVTEEFGAEARKRGLPVVNVRTA